MSEEICAKLLTVPKALASAVPLKEGLTTMDNFSKQIYEAGINDGRAEGKAKYIKNLMSI